MAKRILLSCYEVPGWGGAATSHYQLLACMQADGWEVGYVNLVSAQNATFLRQLVGDNFGNPRLLANVHTCILAPPTWDIQPDLAGCVADSAPDLLLAMGFIAACLMKQAAPHVPLAFLTSGSWEVRNLIESGVVRDFMDFERGVAHGIEFTRDTSRERHAVEGSDLIFVHSPLVRYAFEHLFPTSVAKIYSNIISVADWIYREAEAFATLRRPFAERDVDLVFMASNWQRLVKNYPLVRQLVDARKELTIHIVGDGADRNPAATYHGTLTQRGDIYGLLGRTKALVCPSLLDAAPGVLFEASAMGCNVIASPNCGNWRLCHPQLVADRCSRDAFLKRIDRALSAPYPDNRDHFRGGYADLVETLRVF